MLRKWTSHPSHESHQVETSKETDCVCSSSSSSSSFESSIFVSKRKKIWWYLPQKLNVCHLNSASFLKIFDFTHYSFPHFTPFLHHCCFSHWNHIGFAALMAHWVFLYPLTFPCQIYYFLNQKKKEITNGSQQVAIKVPTEEEKRSLPVSICHKLHHYL